VNSRAHGTWLYNLNYFYFDGADSQAGEIVNRLPNAAAHILSNLIQVRPIFGADSDVEWWVIGLRIVECIDRLLYQMAEKGPGSSAK